MEEKLEKSGAKKARHGVGFILGIIALVFICASFLVYLLSANDSYGYDAVLVGLYVVTIAADVVFMFRDRFGIGPVVVGVLAGFTQGMIVNRRFIYFMTGVLGISQEGISGGMLMTILLLVPAVLINIVGAFMVHGRKEGATGAYAA